jgi:hypothetical protein
MIPTVELWDQITGYALGDLHDDAAAVAILTTLVETFGPDFAATVAVIRREPIRRGEPAGSGLDVPHRFDHAWPESAD